MSYYLYERGSNMAINDFYVNNKHDNVYSLIDLELLIKVKKEKMAGLSVYEQADYLRYLKAKLLFAKSFFWG